MTEKYLLEQAQKAKEFAYTPYFHFRVGAALLTESGKVYTGCNVENAAGSSICAERTALVKAVSEGECSFKAIAIVSDGDDFIYPCGVCRQALVEFSPDMKVVTENAKNEIKIFTLDELLPNFFGPKSLK
ncbi:MAG: cytidine deaminase [Clostridia bacterium]